MLHIYRYTYKSQWHTHCCFQTPLHPFHGTCCHLPSAAVDECHGCLRFSEQGLLFEPCCISQLCLSLFSLHKAFTHYSSPLGSQWFNSFVSLTLTTPLMNLQAPFETCGSALATISLIFPEEGPCDLQAPFETEDRSPPHPCPSLSLFRAAGVHFRAVVPLASRPPSTWPRAPVHAGMYGVRKSFVFYCTSCSRILHSGTCTKVIGIPHPQTREIAVVIDFGQYCSIASCM